MTNIDPNSSKTLDQSLDDPKFKIYLGVIVWCHE